MFERIALKDFKGIGEGDVKLWLFTLLVGKNNSGKTTLLEALYLAPNPFRSVFGEPVPMKGGGDTALHCLAYLHESLDAGGFGFLVRDYVAEISLTRYFLEGGKSFELAFRRDKDVQSRITVFYTSKEDRRLLGSLNLSSNYIEIKRKDLLLEKDVILLRNDLLKLYWKMFRRRWVDISNMGIGSTVAPKISELVDEEYDDLTLEPFGNGLAIYLRRSDGRRVRISDLGDGAQLFLTALILKELLKPGVILWDDLEAHMNPQMITYTLEWLRDLVREGTQVIATTHSLEVLSKAVALMGEEEWFKILMLRLSGGKLLTKPLSGEEAASLIEGGLDLRLAGALL